MHRNSEKLSYKRRNRSKTYRKKHKRYKKEISARNKRLITRYPWLRVIDNSCWKWSDIPVFRKDFQYINLWDDVPKGWINAFGYQLCDEIEQALEKDNLQNKVYIEQAKEKYGQLRIYMTGNDEIYNIISIYETISEHICCECGRPHSPMMNFSWISPYCKNCFEKIQRRNEYFYKGEYEKYAPEDKKKWRIPTELKWTRFSKDGETVRTVDISDRVTKIERLWNERHPDDEV